MKKNQFPVAFKASLLFLACVIIFGFGNRTPSKFHSNIERIVNGTVISQSDLAQVMQEAEQRKTVSQTASAYITNYMNAHFKAAPSSISSTNRVSIAAPGQSDQNMSVACNLTALKTVTSSTIGYYYAFATKCDGTYKYDGKNYTGGSTVYVRAEASSSILEAFILF